MKVIVLTALVVTAVWGQESAKRIEKVVFVCEHGSAKSIIAAAEFERLAKQKGIAVEVVARGTNPDAEIGAAIRQGLRQDGIDVGSAKPVKVSTKDLEGATRVVTFGQDLTEWLPKGSKAMDWSATPSPSQDFTATKEYILQQLEALTADMKRLSVGAECC